MSELKGMKTGEHLAGWDEMRAEISGRGLNITGEIGDRWTQRLLNRRRGRVGKGVGHLAHV